MEGLETRWRVIIVTLYAVQWPDSISMLLAANDVAGEEINWPQEQIVYFGVRDSEHESSISVTVRLSAMYWRPDQILTTWLVTIFLPHLWMQKQKLLLCMFGWIWLYGHRFSSAESCTLWIALGRVNKPGRVWHHLVFPQAPWARWHYQISFESKHAFLTLLRKTLNRNLTASLSVL